MEHTKGQWFVGRALSATEVIPIKIKYSTGNIGIVAYAAGYDVDPGRPQEEIQANAALIAAAPELLEACLKSTAPNYLTEFQHWAEDMAYKPTMAAYRSKFVALITLLRRTAESAEQIQQAIAKAKA